MSDRNDEFPRKRTNQRNAIESYELHQLRGGAAFYQGSLGGNYSPPLRRNRKKTCHAFQILFGEYSIWGGAPNCKLKFEIAFRRKIRR